MPEAEGRKATGARAQIKLGKQVQRYGKPSQAVVVVARRHQNKDDKYY